jgi:RNA polymerase sigma-70 factor (ECF subfamily)
MRERTKHIALARSILRQSHLVEDVHQDMMAKVFENEDQFEGPRHLRDWSWKVLRNRCYELIRQQKYRATLLEESVLDLVDSALESRDTEDFDRRADALDLCLGELTTNAKEVIRLRFFEGLRGYQVAEQLGRKTDAVYKALQRAYVTLGDCIRRKLAQVETGESNA